MNATKLLLRLIKAYKRMFILRRIWAQSGVKDLYLVGKGNGGCSALLPRFRRKYDPDGGAN